MFLIVFPWLMPYHALAINILIWGLFALGFNLLFGYAGLLSFGHAAFLGVGSYGCGIAIVHFGWPWYVGDPAGIAFAAVVALVIGYLAIRTRGIYFSMVTLALAECVYYIFYKWESVTGGENGLRGINVSTINLFGIERRLSRPGQQVLRDAGRSSRSRCGCFRASSPRRSARCSRRCARTKRAPRPAATTSRAPS